MPYDEALPHYYNNNQRFIQKHLDPSVIQNTTIFEKAEIRWVCVDELQRMRKRFRSYFQAIVDKLLSQKDDINDFMNKRVPREKMKTNKTRREKNKRKKRNITVSSRNM